MTTAELITLLQQVPRDAEIEVEGDEIVPPRLNVLLPHAGRSVCLLDPNHGAVDHANGRILW